MRMAAFFMLGALEAVNGTSTRARTLRIPTLIPSMAANLETETKDVLKKALLLTLSRHPELAPKPAGE